LVRDIARSGVNALVLGETGVGKEVLAETLHRVSGRQGAFVRVNCATLAPTLFESELFGHEKGAFTGAAARRVGLLEAAQGGTVFLDEVGELPAAAQAKLLRVIETKEIVRVGGVIGRGRARRCGWRPGACPGSRRTTGPATFAS
jgi:transcriptional regulator with PAS, ATPase and Fis domain